MRGSDLDMSLHLRLAGGNKRLAVLADEMGLLHVLGEDGPESRDVTAFVASVGLDVTMDSVHVVPQLLMVGVSIVQLAI